MDKRNNIGGCEIAYSLDGEGERTLVMLHGWGCTRQTLASVRDAALKVDGYRVLNVDFPGFGQSAEPPAIWGVEDYTRQIELLLQSEGVTRPSLLGHSFGGRVALLYASRNAVDKLILVDAAGVKPRRKPKYYIKVWGFKLAKRLWEIFMGEQRAQQKIEAYRRSHSSADYLAASPRMRGVLSKVVNEDLRHVMPSIKAPTLLIWGENDTATPLADARQMERLIPGAGLVSFPGCGHYSFFDNPRQFAAVLQSFLNS